MSDYKPQIGDKVKVTFEGTYEAPNGGFGSPGVRPDGHPEVFLHASHALRAATSVEKIEPPVEVFKPGDVVRHKRHGDIRAIGNDGWVNLTHGDVITGVYDLDQRFTSDKYERVNVG